MMAEMICLHFYLAYYINIVDTRVYSVEYLKLWNMESAYWQPPASDYIIFVYFGSHCHTTCQQMA